MFTPTSLTNVYLYASLQAKERGGYAYTSRRDPHRKGQNHVFRETSDPESLIYGKDPIKGNQN